MPASAHIMFKSVVFVLILVVVKVANFTDISFYEILGVTKEASAQEIRQAYKKLALIHHPDKNPNEKDQKMFLEITEAYETLKDPEKKRKYDSYGVFSSYTRKYDYQSQAEYNNLYYNGLYHDDPFVDTVSGSGYAKYLTEGFHFLNFYSPFCPPCQNLADTWKKLAETYKGIVKIGAVNCKYHNSFCYNSMRISSYPTLLFYPNGNKGNFVYYRGESTHEELDRFIMKYVNSQVHVASVARLLGGDTPTVYVMGAHQVERDGLVRIAYHLKGIATVVIVEDDDVRGKLSTSDETTVVYKFRNTIKEIQSIDEKRILEEIVEALPAIESIDPEKFKDIRNQLRNGYNNPWILYFSSKGDDRLILQKMRNSFPDLHFGAVDCDLWRALCASLQAPATPAWAALKPGGAYQRARAACDARAFLRSAARARSLHTLSPAELQPILDGDVGAWILLVVPYQSEGDDIEEAFTRTSLRFSHVQDLQFGIVWCESAAAGHCRALAGERPAALAVNGTRRLAHGGALSERLLREFVDSATSSAAVELDERQVLEILDAAGRERSWLVAHLPERARCDRYCDELAHQFQLIAKKLQPLHWVRVGVQRCGAGEGGFCGNVRAPTARLYPLAGGAHHTASLQQLSQAPLILEWALEHLDDSVLRLDWRTFANRVAAEDLRPASDVKPWLVYFHSPRCYRCYEMYPEFAIAGILLNNAVNLGKVNCLAENSLCRQQQVTGYPSLKLYLNRNQRQSYSSVVSIHLKDYSSLLADLSTYLRRYDENLLARFDLDNIGVNGQAFRMKHDEL